MKRMTLFFLGVLLSSALGAQEKVVNVYSSRHYQTDEALYADFTRATGIKINRIEGGEDSLIERIRNEGARSPADVLITVDAGRLWRAEQLGLFQPVKSAVLDARIPASFREPGGLWFGFSLRARVIAYDKAMVKPGEIATYEQGNIANHVPSRDRKLLLHRGEIESLYGKVRERGLTLVPTRMYWKDGRAKVEIALARGKQTIDKRRDIAKRDADRAMQRALKARR